MSNDIAESAAVRAARVLLAFTLEPSMNELTVSEVASHVGRERSQISRLLKALASTGLVEQNPETRSYRLGWQAYRLAARAGDHRLLMASRPALRMLVARTRETALLSVLSANRSLTVARERSPQSLQTAGWIGRTSPLFVTASGRALMMAMSDKEVSAIIREDMRPGRYGPNAPTTIHAVLDLLAEERSRGYTVAADQLEDGLTSIGAPIIGMDGSIVACLNVSGPSSRFAPLLSEMVKPLLAAASQVSRQLTQT